MSDQKIDQPLKTSKRPSELLILITKTCKSNGEVVLSVLNPPTRENSRRPLWKRRPLRRPSYEKIDLDQAAHFNYIEGTDL